MNTSQGPARWGFPAVVATALLVWSGCTSTPQSDEEPVAEAGQDATPAAPDPGAAAAEASQGAPASPVAPIQPFSDAYYAERLAEIEAGLKPLTSIPSPIVNPQQPQVHNR